MTFTAQNTQGYTANELAALNAEFDRRAAAAGITVDDIDAAKSLAESVLRDFDTAHSAA